MTPGEDAGNLRKPGSLLVHGPLRRRREPRNLQDGSSYSRYCDSGVQSEFFLIKDQRFYCLEGVLLTFFRWCSTSGLSITHLASLIISVSTVFLIISCLLYLVCKFCTSRYSRYRTYMLGILVYFPHQLRI